MRSMRRVLVVCLMVATPLFAAAACTGSPPPASDTTATAIFDVGQILGTIYLLWSVATCSSRPGCSIGWAPID
jgi:hypothetical protein